MATGTFDALAWQTVSVGQPFNVAGKKVELFPVNVVMHVIAALFSGKHVGLLEHF